MCSQRRERHVNVQFIPHPKNSASKHTGQISGFCIGRNQTITEHVAQRMKVVRDGVNVRQWLCDGRKLLTGDLNTSLGEFLQKDVDQLLTVNTCLDVHDAVQS